MDDTTQTTVTINKERLEQLELLERNLPTMIQDAIDNYKKDKLKQLHEKDKLDPTLVNERVKRYAKKHKDTINAKRREKRKENKEKEPKNEETKPSVITTAISTNDLTVRF